MAEQIFRHNVGYKGGRRLRWTKDKRGSRDISLRLPMDGSGSVGATDGFTRGSTHSISERAEDSIAATIVQPRVWIQDSLCALVGAEGQGLPDIPQRLFSEESRWLSRQGGFTLIDL